MAQKDAPQTMHRSMQGKLVDMNKLMNQNEMTIAVGNMNVNARGDKLGPGGTIIAKREQLQAGSTGIPDQINVRATEVPAPAPVVTPTPVSPVTALPVKNVVDMDPEGKE